MPCCCSYPFTTHRALYRTTSPDGPRLYLKTHLPLRTIRFAGESTRDHVPLLISESISSLAACSHFSRPLCNIASFQDFVNFQSDFIAMSPLRVALAAAIFFAGLSTSAPTTAPVSADDTWTITFSNFTSSGSTDLCGFAPKSVTFGPDQLN